MLLRSRTDWEVACYAVSGTELACRAFQCGMGLWISAAVASAPMSRVMQRPLFDILRPFS
eukprot:2794728-Rhodomonas_salina.4